jgi:hypothetical protein
MSLSVSASAAEWRTFNDPEGTFSFEAPDVVQTMQQAGTRPDGIAAKITLYTYGSNLPGLAACGLTSTEFVGATLPENAPQSTAVAFKAQLQAVKVQPDVDADITVDGRAGRRFEFKDLKGNGVAIRWFAIKNRLLQLTCTTAPNASADDMAEVTRVVGSLHFMAR